MNPICTHIQDRLIERQLTGQTGPDDSVIQAHLQTCALCREFQEQLDRDHGRLAQYAQSVEPLVTSLQDRVAQRLGSAHQRRYGLRRLNSPVSMSVAAGVLIVVAVWAVLYRPDAPSVSTNEPRPITAEPAPLPMGDRVPSSLDQEQAQAKTLFVAYDVEGLMNLLETGLASTQVLVAGYLAELNASQATPALQRLAAAWTGDPGSNPFAQAMERLKAIGLEPNRPLVGQATAKAPAVPTGSGPALRFKVIDKISGQPLAGARISDHAADCEYICDANGCCEIGVPAADRHRWALVVASRPGYVGTCMKFIELNEEVLSKTHVLALEPGTVIGGIVQDANGSPIQDAVVSFLIRGDNGDVSDAGKSTSGMPFLYIDFKQKTDAAGRWSCDAVPADLLGLPEETQCEFSVDHNDFASERCNLRDAATVKALRDLALPVILYEGSTFMGRLVNIKGEPIVGARISYGGQLYPTGPDGRFEFHHIHSDTTDLIIWIEADGYAKLDKKINYRPNIGEVEIVADPGWMLSGRVKDIQGRPVADAEIEICTFYSNDRMGNTDAEGNFVIGPIPTTDSWRGVHISKKGFRMTSRSINGPTDQSMDIILYPPISASGTVLDAQTGRPIERFRAKPGLLLSDGKVFFDPSRSINVYPGKAGHYECLFDRIHSSDPNNRYIVIIEAEGYLPLESRVIDPEEGEVVIDLALTTGTGPAGTVVDMKGLPVADAVVSPQWEARYDGSMPLLSRDSFRVKTGEYGRFSFEPLYQLRYIMAIAEQGICSMTVEDLERTKVMMLQLWVEVRGKVHSTLGEPVKGQPVQIGSLPDSETRVGYKWNLSTTTDDQGAFQIRKVPPGEFTLLGKTYQVAPGQVLRLDLTVDPNAPVKPAVGP